MATDMKRVKGITKVDCEKTNIRKMNEPEVSRTRREKEGRSKS